MRELRETGNVAWKQINTPDSSHSAAPPSLLPPPPPRPCAVGRYFFTPPPIPISSTFVAAPLPHPTSRPFTRVDLACVSFHLYPLGLTFHNRKYDDRWIVPLARNPSRIKSALQVYPSDFWFVVNVVHQDLGRSHGFLAAVHLYRVLIDGCCFLPYGNSCWDHSPRLSYFFYISKRAQSAFDLQVQKNGGKHRKGPNGFQPVSTSSSCLSFVVIVSSCFC